MGMVMMNLGEKSQQVLFVRGDAYAGGERNPGGAGQAARHGHGDDVPGGESQRVLCVRGDGYVGGERDPGGDCS